YRCFSERMKREWGFGYSDYATARSSVRSDLEDEFGPIARIRMGAERTITPGQEVQITVTGKRQAVITMLKETFWEEITADRSREPRSGDIGSGTIQKDASGRSVVRTDDGRTIPVRIRSEWKIY